MTPPFSTTASAPPCQSSCPMEMSETLAGARSSAPNDIVAVAAYFTLILGVGLSVSPSNLENSDR